MKFFIYWFIHTDVMRSREGLFTHLAIKVDWMEEHRRKGAWKIGRKREKKGGGAMVLIGNFVLERLSLPSLAFGARIVLHCSARLGLCDDAGAAPRKQSSFYSQTRSLFPDFLPPVPTRSRGNSCSFSFSFSFYVLLHSLYFLLRWWSVIPLWSFASLFPSFLLHGAMHPGSRGALYTNINSSIIPSSIESGSCYCIYNSRRDDFVSPELFRK